MSDVWSARAAGYIESDAHREGADLDQLVTWAKGSRTALDVATGGGHVARRLRDVGIEVVTTDQAPGMRPDVVSRAEHLPFADGSFDSVVCRTAAHHFDDVRAAVREMARVSAQQVLIVDTIFMGDAPEEAEKLRDPSHVRNYADDEWAEIVVEAGLALDDVRFFPHTFDYQAWLDRCDCTGETADRVTALWGERVADGRLTLDKIAIRAVKGS